MLSSGGKGSRLPAGDQPNSNKRRVLDSATRLSITDRGQLRFHNLEALASTPTCWDLPGVGDALASTSEA